MQWFSDDGLLALDPSEVKDGYEGSVSTVGNDNGILFRVVWEILRRKSGEPTNDDNLLATIERLEHPVDKGLFLRNPKAFHKDEKHDNYAAICTGCALIGNTDIPNRIYTRGSRTGFYFDHKQEPYHLRNIRQGGEIAFYSLASGHTPYLFNWVWLLGGLLINAFRPAKNRTRFENHISDAQLAWIRVVGIDALLEKNTYAAPWLAPSWAIVKLIWEWRTTKKYGHVLAPVSDYYLHPEHPCKLLSKRLMRDEHKNK